MRNFKVGDRVNISGNIEYISSSEAWVRMNCRQVYVADLYELEPYQPPAEKIPSKGFPLNMTTERSDINALIDWAHNVEQRLTKGRKVIVKENKSAEEAS